MLKQRYIRVRYFALLKEQRGCEDETVHTDATTPDALYRQLCDLHGLSIPREVLKVAVNDELSQWDRALQDGDCVVFLPPVAGG